jgi:hypothetical protein
LLLSCHSSLVDPSLNPTSGTRVDGSDPFYKQATLFALSRFARLKLFGAQLLRKDLNHPHTAVCGISPATPALNPLEH